MRGVKKFIGRVTPMVVRVEGPTVDLPAVVAARGIKVIE